MDYAPMAINFKMTPKKQEKRNRKKASRHSPQHLKAIEERDKRGGRPPQVPKNPRYIHRPIDLPEASIARVKAMLIYEDAHVLAFHKPSGLSSQGGRGDEHNMDDLMWAFARSNGKRPRLVHRLDRDTSGLLLVAKTQPDAAYIGNAIAARNVHKSYLCVVSASEKLEAKGTINAPLIREDIGREAYSRIALVNQEGAQTAQTDYEVLIKMPECALVRCFPLTGRMHQIRVHMAHLGAPILGDVRYGGALSCNGFVVPRLMLHAYGLDFPHPKGERLRLTCPMDEALTGLVNRLGLQINY